MSTDLERILKIVRSSPALLLAWPKDFQGRAKALKGLLDRSRHEMTSAQAAKFFKRAPVKQVTETLEAMAGVGILAGYDTDQGRMYRAPSPLTGRF